jgi:magnesium transporter
MRPSERQVLWELVPPDDEGDILLELNDEVRAGIIATMDDHEIVAAADGMELDDLADFLTDLPETIIQQVMLSMDQQHQDRLQAVLGYPEDSAGGLMNPDTVTVRPDVTIEVVLRYLRVSGGVPEKTDALFVVNRHDLYLGTLPLTSLLTADVSLAVSEVMDSDPVVLLADTPAAQVAKQFSDRDLISAAVVDEKGQLLGRITIDDVVDVIREQGEHSLMSMAGLDEDEDMFAPRAGGQSGWV